MAKFTYELQEGNKKATIFDCEGNEIGVASVITMSESDVRIYVKKVLTTGKKWVCIGKSDDLKLTGEFDDTPSENLKVYLSLTNIADYLDDTDKQTFAQLHEKAKAKFEELNATRKKDNEIARLQAKLAQALEEKAKMQAQA